MLLTVLPIVFATLGAAACWCLHARHRRTERRFEAAFAAIAQCNADLDRELGAVWAGRRGSGSEGQ